MAVENLGLDLFSGVDLRPMPPFDLTSVYPRSDVIFSVQSDIGMVYSGNMRPSPGNSSPDPFLGGAFPPGVAPVSIRIQCDAGGDVGDFASFSVYYNDNDGVGLPAMSGLTPSAYEDVFLTGAGAGLSFYLQPGTASAGDYWLAFANFLNDLGPNGFNFFRDGKPIVTPGILNGEKRIAGIYCDGVGDGFYNDMVAFPSVAGSSGEPFRLLIVYRLIGWTGYARICGGPYQGASLLCVTAPGHMAAFNGAFSIPQFLTPGYEATDVIFTGSDADVIKRGDLTPSTGVNLGINNETGYGIGQTANRDQRGEIEFFSLLAIRGASALAPSTAWREAALKKYGSAVRV